MLQYYFFTEKHISEDMLIKPFLPCLRPRISTFPCFWFLSQPPIYLFPGTVDTHMFVIHLSPLLHWYFPTFPKCHSFSSSSFMNFCLLCINMHFFSISLRSENKGTSSEAFLFLSYLTSQLLPMWAHLLKESLGG